MDFILTFDREKHRYAWLKMGHEVARADEVTSQWALRRDALYATAHPSTSQTQEALVPSAQRHLCCPTQAASISKSGCTQGKSSPFIPRERQIVKYFLFQFLLAPLQRFSCTTSSHPPPWGPHSRSNLLQLPGESLLQKRGICPKMSLFCFTLDFKAVKAPKKKKK